MEPLNCITMAKLGPYSRHPYVSWSREHRTTKRNSFQADTHKGLKGQGREYKKGKTVSAKTNSKLRKRTLAK